MTRLVAAIVAITSIAMLGGCGGVPGAGGVARGSADQPLEVQAVPTETPAAADKTDDPVVWVSTVPRLTTPGQQVTITGQGFAPGEAVTVVLLDLAGQQSTGPVAVTADVRGSLAGMALVLPVEAPAGEYEVAAKGLTSLREGIATLWIQTAAPTLVLSRDALQPEEGLTITATGFAPRERVVIYFAGHGGDPLTALSADRNGNLRAENVPLPILPPGEQQLVATGSASLAQATHRFKILPFDPQVVLNASALPQGEAVGFFGRGFAGRDQVEITLEGSGELPLTLRTDDKGRLVAPQVFKLPANLKGQQTFSIHGTRTDRTVRVTFQVIPAYPFVELSSYFGQPGSTISLAVRYLRPRERLEVFVGEGGSRKKLATFRADENGWLPRETSFRIPEDVAPGPLTLSLEGEAARPTMRVAYTVTR